MHECSSDLKIISKNQFSGHPSMQEISSEWTKNLKTSPSGHASMHECSSDLPKTRKTGFQVTLACVNFHEI